MARREPSPVREATGPAATLATVPIYEFRCPNGHLFEVFQRMNEPGPTECEVCGASPVTRVFHPVPVHFKGSGFYSTDYGRGSRKPDKEEAAPKADEGVTKKKDEKKEEKKKPAEA